MYILAVSVISHKNNGVKRFHLNCHLGLFVGFFIVGGGGLSSVMATTKAREIVRARSSILKLGGLVQERTRPFSVCHSKAKSVRAEGKRPARRPDCRHLRRQTHPALPAGYAAGVFRFASRARVTALPSQRPSISAIRGAGTGEK